MSAKAIFTSTVVEVREERLSRNSAKCEAPSWIGVDLDGTLAEHNPGADLSEIGEPIEAMMIRVQKWIAQGQTVKIFTARASIPRQTEIVKVWLAQHGLPDLEVTNVKDFGMIELWDDRCVQVNANTGCPMFEASIVRERTPRSKNSRSHKRNSPKLVSKLLLSFGRLASSWNQVPHQEFQPVACARTK